ncbi:spore coat protein U domain-containing protein [Escherichia coli]|nr:spore coat protein U domain-containing protein [Escherichia coli]EFG9152841.1 spore coat protein U domain-containing protein [Escherichia coli]
MRKLKLAAMATLAAATAAGPVAAATISGNMNVKISITNECKTVTATDLDFGSSGVISAAIDATSTITVTCTKGTPFSVGLGQGLNGASVTARKMKIAAGAELLDYQLFRDSGRTLNWGNTVGTDTPAQSTATGAAQTLTVYGRVPIPAVQPSAGTFNDTVAVTVTY